MRSSVHATAVMPERAVATDSPYLFAGADETGNGAHNTLPFPSNLAACIVDNPYPGESTHSTIAPVPICTFSTKVCVSEPSGISTKPVALHCNAPAPLNFWPYTPFTNWLLSSSVQNKNVSSVAAR